MGFRTMFIQEKVTIIVAMEGQCARRAPSQRLGGTLNSSRAASPLVWLVAVMRGGRPLTLPLDVLPLNWDVTEINRTVTCMVLKGEINDQGSTIGVHLVP
ncbi:hypothetical protein TNCV_4818031 [Trichonephila clavipes]|nr:hypothetical protein TNCV_4818031 [Trichonephila clavipes]